MDVLEALAAPPERPPRHHPPRAGRRVHGRRLRPPHRSLRRRDGDAGTGRDEPRHGDRRRLPRPRAHGRAHRADRHRQGPQGVAPVVDIPRMFGRSRNGRRGSSGSGAIPEIVAQGVPGRAAGEARADPHRAARGHRGDARSRRRSARWTSRPAAYCPEPTDEAIEHAADLIAAVGAPDRPRRERRAPARASDELRAFARGLHVPVAATFMGKGAIDDRSHLSLMAVGLQARDHVLSGFDRADLVVSVGYDPVEYAPARWNPDGSKRIIHIDTTAGRGRRGLPPRGRADRRHRRHAPAAARGGPAARASAAATPRPRHESREILVHADLRTGAARASSTPTRPTTAGRSGRRRRSPTCARRSRPTTSWSATSARTRSGSRGCTRRTSPTR